MRVLPQCGPGFSGVAISMTRKWTNIPRGTAFTIGMLVGLIFLFAPRGLTGRLQLTYARVFRWPLEVGRGLTVVAQTTTPPQNAAGQSDYEQLVASNRRLRNEFANLQAQVQELRRQNELLTRLRRKPGWEDTPVLKASVITAAGQEQDELIVGQGQEAGVAVGQYVLSFEDHCIIGTVASVSAKTAKIRVITHAMSRIPVSIAALGVRGFIEGRGENRARIPLVSAEHKIEVGDPVYAEKVRGLLDVAAIVAEVTQCRRDPDNPLLWDIAVRPVCDVAALTDVAVVMPVAQAR